MQRTGHSSETQSKFIGQLDGVAEGDVVMDYEKMKALMEASREESLVHRRAQVKEFPKPDSKPDWKYLDSLQEEKIAA